MKRALNHVKGLVKRVPFPPLLGTITHVSTNDPVAALTFDDGPHPTYTVRLLDILKRHGARATFFMLGDSAKRYPQIVKQVAQEGHTIGNHSWDHPPFSLIPSRERRGQIARCAEALAPYSSPLFRPPWGIQSVVSRLDAARLGYEVVTWSVAAQDWSDRSPDWLADHVIGKLRPGGIVLFHDALRTAKDERYFDREPTLQAVNLLLERLGGHYRFLTVPELLAHGRPVRRGWFIWGNKRELASLSSEQLGALDVK